MTWETPTMTEIERKLAELLEIQTGDLRKRKDSLSDYLPVEIEDMWDELSTETQCALLVVAQWRYSDDQGRAVY